MFPPYVTPGTLRDVQNSRVSNIIFVVEILNIQWKSLALLVYISINATPVAPFYRANTTLLLSYYQILGIELKKRKKLVNNYMLLQEFVKFICTFLFCCFFSFWFLFFFNKIIRITSVFY